MADPVTAPVQGALAICATCSHTADDHQGPCTVVIPEMASACPCAEFWPVSEQREDGLRVIGHELSISGKWPVRLNRRLPAEFWDSLDAGEIVRVEIELEIEGKGFRAERTDGLIAGLRELRRGRVVSVFWDGELL